MDEDGAKCEERRSEYELAEVASPVRRNVSFKEENTEVSVSQVDLQHVQSTAAVAEEIGEDAVMRGRSRSELARTGIERFAVTRERKWSVGIASLVAAIPGLLMGLTLAYPSNAILDLTGEAHELREEFLFDSTLIISLFVVSILYFHL